MDNIKYTFKKDERLCHRSVIDQLFSIGFAFNSYPFRIVWKPAYLNTPSPAQVAITVSKRKFKKAVTRNLLKRRIKEIYRLNKHNLYSDLQNKQDQLAFMIIYLPSEILTTKEMEPKLLKALDRLPKEYAKYISNIKKDSDDIADSTD